MNKTKWFEDALLINRDPNWYGLVTRDLSSAEAAKAEAEAFFAQFTQDRITDVQLCVFENTAIIPSDAVMWRGLKYLQTEENGHPVSYPQLEGLYRLYAELGVDPVQIFIDTMRAGGVRPWITLRMNDAHFGGDETAFLRDDFFYTAEKNGWMIGEEYGYFAHCLDYGQAPVRARMLALIREIVETYDIFGLELDFMREIHSFDYRHNADRHAIMTAFIGEVHEILREAELWLGHPLRLMIRTPRNLADTEAFGFDICRWAENGWVDAVVPTPRWEVTDDAIPVAEWKARLGDGVAVFPGIEILHLRFTHITKDIAKAYSAAWNAQGADGLYFNNHDYATPLHKQVYALHRDNVTEGVRRYIVTYQDISADGSTVPQYRPLPMAVSGTGALTLQVGPIGETDRLTVILDFAGDAAPKLMCGGIAAADGVVSPAVTGNHVDDASPIALTDGASTYAYRCDGVQTDGVLPLTLAGQGELRYLELRIEEITE